MKEARYGLGATSYSARFYVPGWSIWAIVTGLALSLLLRTVFLHNIDQVHQAYENGKDIVTPHHGHHVYRAIKLTDEEGLFTDEKVTVERNDIREWASVDHSNRDKLRSSWHSDGYNLQNSCGHMMQSLQNQRLHKDREPVVWRCGCAVSGLGDRLKGVVAAWMLAMVLERPFLCEVFPSMADLKLGVEPAEIDWRSGYKAYTQKKKLNGLIRTNRASRILTHKDKDNFNVPIEVTQTTPAMVPLVQQFIEKVMGKNASILSTEPFVGDGKSFTDDDAPLVSHPWREVFAHAHFCATRSLIKPTTGLLQLVDSTLARYASKLHRDPFLVATHVRFGGKWNDRKRARDEDAQVIVECVWNMTKAKAVDTDQMSALWMLASDDVERLDSIIAKFRANIEPEEWNSKQIVVAIPEGGKVEHVSKSKNGTDLDSIQRLWHDWFLVSEAHTCALIRSSFPRTACYTSARRATHQGLIQQMVTKLDLGRYPRTIPLCSKWNL